MSDEWPTAEQLEILKQLQSSMDALRGDVREIKERAPLLDGLPVLNRTVTVLQREVRALRDDMTVLTAIVMRLDKE